MHCNHILIWKAISALEMAECLSYFNFDHLLSFLPPTIPSNILTKITKRVKVDLSLSFFFKLVSFKIWKVFFQSWTIHSHSSVREKVKRLNVFLTVKSDSLAGFLKKSIERSKKVFHSRAG
jgi:hypothetical protein